MIDREAVSMAVAARLATHGWAEVRVHGRSMWPTLWSGSRVRVDACAPEDVRLGDLALAETTAGLVLHRVVGRGPGGPILWGDNASGPDSEARVVARAPALVLGRWSLTVADPVRDAAGRLGVALAPGARGALSLVASASRPLRRVAGAALTGPAGRALRRGWGPYEVGPLSPADGAAFRAQRLRRGRPLPGPATRPVVARARSGAIVGQLDVVPDPFRAEARALHDLYVAFPRRGLGLAGRLVEAAVEEVTRQGATLAVAHVRTDARAACRVFEARGFAGHALRDGVLVLHRACGPGA